MTYCLIFCVFLAATLIATIIADAHNLKNEVNKMWTDHYETVHGIDQEMRDKARELYLRHPIL